MNKIETLKQQIDELVAEEKMFASYKARYNLAQSYFEINDYHSSLKEAELLSTIARKTDNHGLLVRLALLQVKCYFLLQDYQKAKAAMVVTASTALTIYCPPILQGEIDAYQGMLTIAESDPLTAFSFLTESFENFKNTDKTKAHGVFLLMALCKLLSGHYDEVKALINSKNGSMFSTDESVLAMAKCSEVVSENDLFTFKQIFLSEALWKTGFMEAAYFIHKEMTELSDKILEDHIVSTLKCYHSISLSHLCSQIGIPDEEFVNNFVTSLIIDGKLSAKISQSEGYLHMKKVSKYNGTLLMNARDVLENLEKKTLQYENLILSK